MSLLGFTQFLDDQFEASITPLQEDLPTELTYVDALYDIAAITFNVFPFGAL